MTDADQMLTVSAVALLLHFSPRTVQRMCVSRELDAVRIRGRWRVRPSSVRALIDASPAKPEGAVA